MGQPAAEGAEVEVGHLPAAHPIGVLEETGDVGEVGADGVRGEVALGDQVTLVRGEDLRRLAGRVGAHEETPGLAPKLLAVP